MYKTKIIKKRKLKIFIYKIKIINFIIKILILIILNIDIKKN
jgi:hypothetical protein